MKLITSIWTTVLLFISLVALRVFDLPIVEQVRLISFDQYIQSLPDKK